MEPRIQFAKTSDGVGIAYYQFGEGPALVLTPGSITNLQTEWRAPGRRDWFERLATDYRIIRYDRRGTGLSDRDVSDYSVDALANDILAVVDHLGVDRFVIWAAGYSGPAAITVAVSHPDRVSGLILYGTHMKGSELMGIRDESSQFLLKNDWDLYTEVLARQTYEWPSSERIRAEASRMREAVTQDDWLRFTEATNTWDVTDLLPQVKCPTVLLYRPDWGNRSPWFKAEIELMRATARAIPGARLAALDGAELAPYIGDSDQLLRELKQFFDVVDLSGEAVRESNIPSGTAIILFADIAGSTGLTERLGDLAFRARARDLDGALRTVIRDLGGTPIEGKLLGDGILAVFASAREGIAAALMCGTAGAQAGLPLHLGLHAGDVISEDNNVYGGAVNTASRISGLSAPGEVLVSETVRSLARTSAGVAFEDRGEQALKGVGEPVRVWAVVTQEQGTGNKEQSR
jgi:class 3 adenylate cyclase